jgi:intracellular sulfur oxidation DsrE/DsrF family protein
MKKINLLYITFLFSSLFFLNTHAQNTAMSEKAAEHRIIFQLTSGDTTSHKQLMKQLNNILTVSPTTQIEIVCHGAGLDMLVNGKTIVADKIKNFSEKGVVFNACEFSMKERKVEREKILTSCRFVEAGIIEIVSKQEKGWSYIKAGN